MSEIKLILYKFFYKVWLSFGNGHQTMTF